jgi:hypothetical protein
VSQEQHTLARKFDAVHRNTVTDSRRIPKVLRATLSNPTPALKPRAFTDAGREEPIEGRGASAGSSKESVNWPALATGTGGSCALIMALGRNMFLSSTRSGHGGRRQSDGWLMEPARVTRQRAEVIECSISTGS